MIGIKPAAGRRPRRIPARRPCSTAITSPVIRSTLSGSSEIDSIPRSTSQRVISGKSEGA